MPGYAALSTPWWVPVVYVLVLGHVTNICTTLYLHRNQTHGGVEFHPFVTHAMRLWLWLTSAIVTREWVAVHRKHHAFADREGDPHSPVVEGLAPILLNGLFFYRRSARDAETLEKYGRGTSDDWIERHVYGNDRTRSLGLFVVLALDMYLFGALLGLAVWSFMTLWVPLMGNIINGAGHALGYRTFETRDHSHNIYPWGIWILGEELHNNHHADPRSAKFQAKWWEFDIGWAYIRMLSFFRLANVLYARSASARDFASKYYQQHVSSPVSEGFERAVATLQAAKEDGLARIEHAREEGRARLESMRTNRTARIDHAREECLARIESVWAEGRGRLDRVKTEGKARLEKVKSEATAELDRARASARASVVGPG